MQSMEKSGGVRKDQKQVSIDAAKGIRVHLEQEAQRIQGINDRGNNELGHTAWQVYGNQVGSDALPPNSHCSKDALMAAHRHSK